MRGMQRKGTTFGNSWLSTQEFEMVCRLAACQALIDAHEAYPSDTMNLPVINYNYTDHTQASMLIWHDMFRTPVWDSDNDDVMLGYTDYLEATISVTPDFINSFYSTDGLECFFYRRFADKESALSRAMPYVAKTSSIITGLALIGICIKHCMEGHLHPAQALSIMAMIAVPAILTAKEYNKNPKTDHLRKRFSDETILESIKCEYRYLKSTPNHANHVLADRLIKEMDKYRPEKSFTDDGFEIYKPENRRRDRPR